MALDPESGGLVNPIYMVQHTGDLFLSNFHLTPLPLTVAYCRGDSPCSITLAGPMPGEYIVIKPEPGRLWVRFLNLVALLDDRPEWLDDGLYNGVPVIGVGGSGDVVIYAPGGVASGPGSMDRLIAWRVPMIGSQEQEGSDSTSQPGFITSVYPLPGCIEEGLARAFREWMKKNEKWLWRSDGRRLSILERITAEGLGVRWRSVDTTWYTRNAWFDCPPG